MSETRRERDTTVADHPEHVPTLIVGAGQAGLATAYHLTLGGHGCVVLDRNRRVGDQWRERYDSLVLNTPAKRDSLPGLPFPGPARAFPTADQLADYHEDYARRFELRVDGGADVRSVVQEADGSWLVSTSRGTYAADNVVVATGGETHPRLPEVADRLDPGIRQLHSHDYRHPEQLLPGPVLVVGLGQSGADIALEVARAGHEVTVSGKAPGEVPVEIDSVRGRIGFSVLWFVWNHLLTERTPPGRRAKQAVRGGRAAPLLRVKRRHLDEAGVRRLEARTTDVVDGRPALADGTVLDVANVIWCTGYRQDFSFIHPSPMADDGWPRDEGGVVPDLPGLYFMGLLFQRGFYSMLSGGAGRDARFIARHILARTRSHT